MATHQLPQSNSNHHGMTWAAWLLDCQDILGHHLDGEEFVNGYSLATAVVAWSKGIGPAYYCWVIQSDAGYHPDAPPTVVPMPAT